MKLRELTTPARRPGPEITEPPADAIRVSRLRQPADVSEPPSLVFATDPPRGGLFAVRGALALAAATVLVLIVVVISAGGSHGGSRHLHAAAPKLTPAQQRLAAERRARAQAIAKARRDRGTDAELQDTIPAVTPAPGG